MPGSAVGSMREAIDLAEVPAMLTYRVSANPPSKPVGRRRNAGSANKGANAWRHLSPGAGLVPG